jgi:hypothetical protein
MELEDMELQKVTVTLDDEISHFTVEERAAFFKSLRLTLGISSEDTEIAVITPSQLAEPPERVVGSGPAFPTFWRLGGYWMSRKVRERYYEPLIGELQLDFEDVKDDYASKWAGRWLRFCFGFRTVIIIARSIRYSSQDGALGYLGSFLPETWRTWLKALFRLG